LPGDGGQHQVDFELESGQPLTGLVQTPSGEPAAGADVVLVTAGQSAYIRDGREIRNQGNPKTETDAEGHFTFPPQSEKFLLAILHETGYRAIPEDQFTREAPIKLEQWAQVKGRAMRGDEPASDRQIALHPDNGHGRNEPRIHHDYGVTTDASGRFAFSYVPPGEVNVALGVRTDLGGGRYRISYSHRQWLQLKPGEQKRVQIGGEGRALTGQAVLPKHDEVAWRFADASLREEIDLPEPPRPDDWATMDREAKQQWYRRWKQSEAGQAFQRKREQAQRQRNRYSFKLESDGRFRVYDVEPGTYQLSIEAHAPPPNNRCGFGETIGSIGRTVNVPETDDSTPIDLGTLELTPRTVLKKGDKAPNFTVPTLDGDKVTLKDLRGQYVLLDFWATWCGPCTAETPNLKQAWEQFGERDDFAMIGLSLDEKQAAPRQYAKKNDLGWIQGFLGDWSNAKLPDRYGVEGIPEIMLIGPDGKVVAKGLRGDAIAQAVQDALDN
jgi:peroxiredoxin